MKKVLVTGSSGFIGQHFMKMYAKKHQLKAVSLREKKVSDLDLDEIDTILHLAGKAHEMGTIDSQIYFDVNYVLTMQLATEAKSSGVQHFIFISTIKVYGDMDEGILTVDSPCNPVGDAYGQSKLKAEEDLKNLNSDNFIVSVIRPPLVYGAGVKGNLQRLMSIVKKAPALPFRGIQNQRSMVYVANLNALIDKIIESNLSGIFIAGDRTPHSTTELAELISNNLNSNSIFFKLPKIFISFFRLMKPSLINRLFDSYVIDNTKTNKKLSFTPPYTFEEGINEMVIDFKNKNQ